MPFDIANALKPQYYDAAGAQQQQFTNQLASDQNARAQQEADTRHSAETKAATDAEMNQHFTRALTAAKYVLASQQPKALLQSIAQQNPDVAQFVQTATQNHGVDWNAVTDDDVRGMAQNIIAHFGAELGQGPPEFKGQVVGDSLVDTNAVGGPKAVYTAPETFKGAPTPMMLDNKPVMAVRGSRGTNQPIPGATPYQAPSPTENRPPAGYRLGKDGNLTFIPGGPADPARGKGGGTIADRMNPTMLASVKLDIAEVRNGLNQINSLTTDTAGAFFAVEHAGPLASIFHRAVTPEQQQNYDVYANRLAVAIASIQSMGRGQISDAKVAEARKLVPQPGDKHSTIKAKLGQISKIANLAEETLSKSGANLTNPVADAVDESYGDTSGLRAPAGGAVVPPVPANWTITRHP